MFRFEQTYWLLGVLLLALVSPFVIRYSRQKIQGSLNLLGGESAFESVHTWERLRLLNILLLLSIGLLFLAAANPQFGSKREISTQKGTDIYIALDVSKSMRAKDVQPSRLDRAKHLVQNVIAENEGNRIGLVIFAGNAYIQMPLTTDYGALSSFVSEVSPEAVPTQGTAIGQAIDLVIESCKRIKDGLRPTLLIISDGESHDEDAEGFASKAGKQGIKVFTVGVGTQEGAPVPEPNPTGEMQYLTYDGQPVISKLNPAALAAIAKAGEGEYFGLQDDNNAVKEITEMIERQEKATYEQQRYKSYESYFQVPLLLALLALLALLRMK